MQVVIVGLYYTRTGKVRAQVKRTEFANGLISYSWLGEWGAACGTYETVKQSLTGALQNRRGVEVVIEFK